MATAGDGNLHALIHVGSDSAEGEAVDGIVYRQVQHVEGSISAEQGVGMSRAPYLELTRSAAELALMRPDQGGARSRQYSEPGKILC